MAAKERVSGELHQNGPHYSSSGFVHLLPKLRPGEVCFLDQMHPGRNELSLSVDLVLVDGNDEGFNDVIIGKCL